MEHYFISFQNKMAKTYAHIQTKTAQKLLTLWGHTYQDNRVSPTHTSWVAGTYEGHSAGQWSIMTKLKAFSS